MTNKRKVLVVDASKVVRVSLAKQLSDRFEVRDEPNDELAWQTMVLDSSIVAVVSGSSSAGPDSASLLERLRESKLSRLKNVPFFLTVSSSFSEVERQEARRCGVTEFIVKDAPGESVEQIVSSHMEWREVESGEHVEAPPAVSEEAFEQYAMQSDMGISNIMGQIAGLEPPDDSGLDEPEENAEDHDETVLAEEMLEEYLSRNLPNAIEGQGVGVLAFGIDGYEDLVTHFGHESAFGAAQKFCSLLSKKIRSEDYIGQMSNGLVVIVTPSSSAQICTGFANRICKAMASSQVSLHGQRVKLTVSVGVAVVPDDGVGLSEEGLLNLAYERLESAGHAGGNRVVSSSNLIGYGQGNCELFLPQLKELMSATDPSVLRNCLGSVGVQLMPLLKELDRHFRLGLPIEEMNRRFWDRSRAERMVR